MENPILLQDVLLPGEYSLVTLHVPGSTPVNQLTVVQLHTIGRVISLNRGHELAAVEVLELLLRRKQRPLSNPMQALADCLRDIKGIKSDLTQLADGTA